ncbi:MAG: transglycosylase SLT domain-containing protein [Bacteroidales bacterium]
MRKIGWILAGALSLAFGSGVQAQEPGADSLGLPLDDYGFVVDTLQLSKELEPGNAANLDSLLNLWYVNQSLEDAVDNYDPRAETLLPDFSDSVYIHRLSMIPSVIDLTYNRIVKNYINVYTRKRREQVRIMMGLSDYYFPMFEEVFDLYGVPYELKYLSVIESALNPRAVSRVGAVGMWQFMYSTGRANGLTINSLVDERRDPLASTHAAARYLSTLYGMYGDWTLALAAYNCGPGNVNKAIRRSGGKRSFWEIYYYLPRETRGYVPAFIAATYTMNFPEEHYLSRAPLELPLHTDTLRIREPLHLQQVADVLDVPVALIRDLNPQYRKDVIPANEKTQYALRLPGTEISRYIDLEESILAYKDSVFFSDSEKVLTPQAYNYTQVDLPADKYDKLTYTVRSGDNVGYIADWYDVRSTDLRYWNNINRNVIRTGQKLVIYKPKGTSAKYEGVNGMSFSEKQRFAGRTAPATSASATPASQAAVTAAPPPSGNIADYETYTVRQGDTLWEIARKYPGVSETDIARLNNLTDASRIKPGQVIRIRRKS